MFKDLATLRTNAALFRNVDELAWQGPTSEFAAVAGRIQSPRLLERSQKAHAALSQAAPTVRKRTPRVAKQR